MSPDSSGETGAFGKNCSDIIFADLLKKRIFHQEGQHGKISNDIAKHGKKHMLKDICYLCSQTKFRIFFRNISYFFTLNLILCNQPIFIFLSIIFPNTFAKPEVIENKVAYDEFQENAQLAFDVHFSNFVREGLLGPKKFSLDESLRNELKERIIAYNYLRKMREGKNPPLCALVLPYDEKDDLIINALEKNSLINSEKNVVKVIYYPSFLTSADFLLGMNYSEFVSTATLGVFPSRYEPWGYTPFETAALRVLSITTNASGFGNFILSMGYGNDFPIYVLDSLNKKRDEVVKELANLMKRVAYMDEEERLILSLKGRKILESLDWKRVIEHYLKAYSLGIKKLINI